MQLQSIFILAGLMILLRLVPLRQVRDAALLIASCIFVFYFQPALPVRELDFMLPLITLLLTLCVYGAFSVQNPLQTKQNLIDAAIIFGVVLLLTTGRYIRYEGILTASRPPQPHRVIIPTVIGCAVSVLLNSLVRRGRKWPARLLTGVILLALVILKTPQLSLITSRMLRTLQGQSAEMALSTDIRWFGFSYIAFRLLSILIDTTKGRKAEMSLGTFLVYVCFPPALSAGPIDRWDRFTKDLRSIKKEDIASDLTGGLGQIALGLFHKFVLADSLAKMALSAQNAGQFIHRGWAWAALIAYGLQIFFDFSGYSEIAIGLGQLFGLHLPKNFDHPYLKGDLTKFWSSWHMTLTQWIRTYVFNPLTRSLRGNREHPLPQWLIILITQLTTMLLIGLWHGVSVNFVIWGLWHGIGLFVHQLYSRKTGSWLRGKSTGFQRGYSAAATLLSDLYVCLGWIWFVIPDFAGALGFFGRLFG